MAALSLKRQFVWTVIPSGRLETGGQRAVFSLLLTPRLIGPTGTRLTVEQFGMQTWPQRLKDLRFVAFKEGREVNAQRIQALNEENQSIEIPPNQQLSVWQSLFPGNKLVRPYQPTSYQNRKVNDFPAQAAGADIKSAFTATARAIAYLDTCVLVGCSDSERAEPPGTLEAALRKIAATWQAAASTPPGQDTALAEPPPLERAYKFYRRDANEFTAFDAEVRAEEEQDFHDVVARLADHPVLLRALGLLIDFAVPVTDLNQAGRNELRVEPRWQPDPNPPQGWGNAVQEDLAPRTAYTLAGTRFLALNASTGAAQSAPGLLPLAGTGLAGEGTNTGFELMPFDVDGAALRMFSVAQSDRGEPPDSALSTAGLPALRSRGFALVEKTRKKEHEARLNRAKDRDTPAKLVASPLMAENLVAGYRIDVFDLDIRNWRSLCRRRVSYTVGGVQIGPTLGLSEEGFVRLAGATTGSGATDAIYIHETVGVWDGYSSVVPRPERVAVQSGAAPPPSPAPPFTVQVDVEKGSLPPLQFGREYRLRVRLVDLAGGGLRRGQPGLAEQASKEVVHRRFEPLLAPELVPTSAYVDGAGQGLMIIRSDRDTTAAAYAASHGYQSEEFRYLFASKISLGLAMQHPGAFDAALGQNNEQVLKDQFEIAKRADNDLAKVDRAQLIPGDNNSGSYYVVPKEPAKLPWLADFASYYIAFGCPSRPVDPDTNRPGDTTGFDTIQYKWKGSWPAFVPIALKVVAANDGCKASHSFVGEYRTFTVALGPAEQVTVPIISCPDVNYVPWLGVAHWAGATHDSCNPVNNSIYRGRNPLVTPPRTVTMVHAVQRPLCDPSGRLIADRAMGDTHAVLDTSKLDIHVPSTGRIDLRAEWEDIEDSPPKQPRKSAVVANVGSYDVAHLPLLRPPPFGAFPLIRQEFGDVRRRKVRYKVAAVSRFRDYFGRVTAQNAQACTVHGTLEFTDVKAAARPAAPKIRYTVPTFRWSRNDGGNVLRSSRRAGGLRVMLERPWFVSGDDEALAVVVWPQSSPAPTAKELRLLSLAGRDPLWTTAAPPAILNQTHVKATAESVSLPELGKTVFAMISPLDFDRNFDREADCWFADIDLSPVVEASYFPFVRLSLCRYQGHIADLGQRLSPPIQTEPLQLFPHRDLTVTRNPGRASVVVKDPNPAASRLTGIQAQLQVWAGDPRAAADGLIGPSGWTVLKQATGKLGDNLELEIPPGEGRPLRIAVTESESYPGTAGSPSRIVYADTVALPTPA